MPKLQIQVNGRREAPEYDDFVGANRALTLAVKQQRYAPDADIRIVPVIRGVGGSSTAEIVAMPGTLVRGTRSRYQRAPHHNTVMTVWGLMCLFLGMAIGHWLT